MNKKSIKLIICTVIILAIAGGFLVLKGYIGKSTSPGGTRPGAMSSGGPMGGPPSSEALDNFKKLHKYAFQLMTFVRNIARMEESSKCKLSPQQAKTILAVLKPLRESESLDETAAKNALNSIRSIMTEQQFAAISSLPDEHPFQKATRPSGGRPSGMRPAGPPPGANPQSMRGFNPLNMPAGMRGPKKGESPLDKFFKTLETKSAGA